MEKGLPYLDRIQPVLLMISIGIGLIIADLAPLLSKKLIPVVTFGVFLVIYLIMVGVDFRNLLNAFTKIKPTTLAIVINFVFTPLYAWFLGYLFLQNNPDVWVGLILYLLTPCIGWYLIFTELADGDVELGISLLAYNVFLQIALMPVYMKVLAGRIIFIDINRILKSIFIFLIIPLILSVITRKVMKIKGILIEDFKPNISYLKTGTLILVIIAMFASQGSVLFNNPEIVIRMILPGLIFFFSVFTVALGVGYLFGLNYREVALLSFTLTARNSEASLAIAATAFTSPLVPLTVVIGPSIELPVLIIILRILMWIRGRGWYPYRNN